MSSFHVCRARSGEGSVIKKNFSVLVSKSNGGGIGIEDLHILELAIVEWISGEMEHGDVIESRHWLHSSSVLVSS